MLSRIDWQIIYNVTVNSEELRGKGKGKEVPLQAWSGPENSRKLRVPRLHDNGTGWW